MHSLYPNKVRLQEDVHKYFDESGVQYMGFSSFFGFMCKKFDANAVAGHIARNTGSSKQDLLDNWNSRTDNGTRIDAALTLYAQTGQVLTADADIADLIKSVLLEYKEYNTCYEQLVVYNENYRTAGSLDKLFLYTNRKDSAFGLSDFKAFEKQDLFEHRGWLNTPFDYLPNNKYTKISFQLSFYAHHFEELTGRKCKRLFIHLIDPINKTHHKVPVMYMKREVMFALEHFKEEIINELDGKIQEAF